MSVKQSSRGSVTILAPQVDLDGLGYADLKEACERMVEEGKHQVVLDLTQVHYINSICIGYLVQFWQRLLNKRGFLAVVGCQEGVNRLISYSGIDKKIPFHADVDTAIAAHENGEGAGEEIDETAFIDGYSFPRFFVKIFFPLIAPGIAVTAFFCFTFSWVELILAKTLATTAAKPVVVTLTVGIGAEGVKWGLLAAAGVLTIIPGVLVVYFVRNYMAKGFALGRV